MRLFLQEIFKQLLMKKLFTTFFYLFTFVVLFACKNNSKSELNKIETPDNEVVEAKLDSNFVLENLVGLKNFEAIAAKFGRENLVKDSTISELKNVKIVASILYPKTENEVLIFWDKIKGFSKINSVIVRCNSISYNGKWHSTLGLIPGQSLAKIMALNKKEFTISGFGWEYGGHVVSWEGGLLDQKNITGRFSDLGVNKLSEQENASIKGDTEFNISLPAIKKLNPILTELTVLAK